jgi:hypothetical protein
MADAIAEPKTEVTPPVVAPVVAAPVVDKPVTPAPTAPVAPADNKTILGGEPPKEVKPAGAPEYTDFTLPEGIMVDKDTMAKAVAEFKTLNLSQADAQKLVTIQAEYVKANNAAILESFNKQVAEWKDESVKMFGNDSEKEFGIAAKAVERFGTPAFKAMLNETGIGNHPEWVRFCNKIGKTVSEDNPVDGIKAGERKTDAEILYPNMVKKK